MIEAKGNEVCLVKSTLPEGGEVSVTQIGHGTMGRQSQEIWGEDFDASQKARRLPLRTAGVDRDGAPVQVVSDQIDVTLDELSPAKVRVGAHFRWNSWGGRREGQVYVVEEIDRLVKLLLIEFGESILNHRVASRRAKGSKYE